MEKHFNMLSMAWRKKIWFLFLVWLSTQTVYAGKDTTVFVPKRNCVYAELGGKAFLWSINYARTIAQKKSWWFQLQTGLSYSGWGFGPYVPVPVSLIGLKKIKTSCWHYEVSLGALFLPSYDPTSKAQRNEFRNHPKDFGQPFIDPFDAWYQASLGMRYERNWSFRFSCIPMYIRSWYDLKHYGAVRIGLSFGKTF